jgi:hypothetical protein
MASLELSSAYQISRLAFGEFRLARAA